ncbi:MAG: phosphate ABC transporter substrate-binding protein [Lentisphaeria bacterium]|nr:phosphate ABC transporter substrate-binding protein [Lentisphaeria bacterium]
MAILWTCFASHVQSAVVVIVHAENPTEHFTAGELSSIYLGKKSFWANSERISVKSHMEKSVNQDFLRLYVRKTPAQFKAYWRKMVFTGKGAMPRFLESSEMLEQISQNKNAIGFIDESLVEGIAGKGVKVVLVEG